MAGLSLREAAQQAGTSKSTILRAIQKGRLSASRTEDGGYSIDPAELFRVYPRKGDTVAPQRTEEQSAGQDATPNATLRNVQLEAEISTLKALLENERQRAEELREERDRWAAQAERLTLAPPVKEAARRRWWPFSS